MRGEGKGLRGQEGRRRGKESERGRDGVRDGNLTCACNLIIPARVNPSVAVAVFLVPPPHLPSLPPLPPPPPLILYSVCIHCASSRRRPPSPTLVPADICIVRAYILLHVHVYVMATTTYAAKSYEVYKTYFSRGCSA